MKANGGGATTALLKDDDTTMGRDSRRSSTVEGGNGGRVKYRRTRSVGRAEEITKEENKQRISQPDKP